MDGRVRLYYIDLRLSSLIGITQRSLEIYVTINSNARVYTKQITRGGMFSWGGGEGKVLLKDEKKEHVFMIFELVINF